jgi:hypothetical protein
MPMMTTQRGEMEQGSRGLLELVEWLPRDTDTAAGSANALYMRGDGGSEGYHGGFIEGQTVEDDEGVTYQELSEGAY